MPNAFRASVIWTAALAAIPAALPMASAQSAELTNGPNGTQPNTLDSESGTGSAGVAPSREIYHQGSNLRPGSVRPDARPGVAVPKTQGQ